VVEEDQPGLTDLLDLPDILALTDLLDLLDILGLVEIRVILDLLGLQVHLEMRVYKAWMAQQDHLEEMDRSVRVASKVRLDWKGYQDYKVFQV
jgi:hypothetical protein